MSKTNVENNGSTIKGFNPWYRINPREFLHQTFGLKQGEVAVFTTIFFSILDQQRPIRDEVEDIAYRLKMKPSHCRDYLDGLLRKGRLKSCEGFLYNERAIALINEMIERYGGIPFKFPPDDLPAFVRKVEAEEAVQEEMDLRTFRHADPTRSEVVAKSEPTRRKSGKKANENNGDSDKNQNQIQNPPLPPEGDTDEVVDHLFEKVFWPAYPRHEGKGKAREAFGRALKVTDINVIMKGVKGYAAMCKSHNQDMKMIRHPTTWLNGKGWEDEYRTGKLGDSAPAAGRPQIERWTGK